MVVTVQRKYIFLIVYLISMLCLFFSSTDYISFTSVLQKAKYVYTIFLIADIIQKRNTKKISKTVILVLLIYLIFSVLYRTIFINPNVLYYTSYQFELTIWALIMIFLTYVEIETYDCFEEWCFVTFFAISILMATSLITHLEEFGKNPIYWLISLKGDEGTSGKFGLDHKNYAGFFCFTGLITSYFSLSGLDKIYFTSKKDILRFFILISDILYIGMLGNVVSRSAVTSLLIFYGMILVRKIFHKIHPEYRINVVVISTIFIIIFCIILNNIGLFQYMWDNSHRELNTTVNIPIFNQYGNIWTGLGWVDNSAFQDTIDAFGYGTSSLDMFYLYVYISTGFIGCVFMSIVYGLMGFKLLNSKDKNKYIYVFLFITLLYYQYWECVLFTIELWGGIILVIILFHGMTVDKGIHIGNKTIV